MNAVRSPFSSEKYAASGFKSARIRWIVDPRLPFLAAAFPASTGIETFNNIRMLRPLHGQAGVYALHQFLIFGIIHRWCSICFIYRQLQLSRGVEGATPR